MFTVHKNLAKNYKILFRHNSTQQNRSIPSLGLGYGLFALPALASIAGIAILYKKEQDKEEKLVKADTESIRQIQKLSSLSVFPACLLPHPFLLILSPIPATMNYFTSKALFERTDTTLSVKNGALVGLGTAFIAHVGAGIILSGIQFEQGFFTRAFAIFGFSLVFVGVCTIPSAALAGSGIFYYLQNKQKERESINQD